MKVSVKFPYTEMVIPPRCRKLRPQEGEAEISVNIREVDESVAPIAFIVNEFDQEPRIVRLYKGKLYRQLQDRRKDYDNEKRHVVNYPLWVNQKANEFDWQWHLKFGTYYGLNKLENINKIKERGNEYIIISGEAYERTGEPYYYVSCFGLGNNHGGTGFFVGWNYFRDRTKVWGLSASDPEAAVERAVQIALNRGDDKSVDSIRAFSQGTINVIIPEAIKRSYANDY